MTEKNKEIAQEIFNFNSQIEDLSRNIGVLQGSLDYVQEKEKPTIKNKIMRQKKLMWDVIISRNQYLSTLIDNLSPEFKNAV